jgi:hypothetical protein
MIIVKILYEVRLKALYFNDQALSLVRYATIALSRPIVVVVLSFLGNFRMTEKGFVELPLCYVPQQNSPQARILVYEFRQILL